MTWQCQDGRLVTARSSVGVFCMMQGTEVAAAEARGTESMGIIAWIVLGAIAGFIATLITGTREGVVMTIILGIVGALVGGFLAGVFLNVKDPTGINVETIVVSVIGAIIVVFVVNLLGAGRHRGTA
jgi:uncharacterized membrane protein YeaQ/YmgE (transglycosylase-associated protein family)